MAKKRTAGVTPLTVEIDDGIYLRLVERCELERRTKRAVLERAIVHYLDTITAMGELKIEEPPQPKRGRPPKAESPKKEGKE